MKQLQNNFTTPEQSKRLLELGVPADSADCYLLRTRTKGETIIVEVLHDELYSKKDKFTNVLEYLPCWSVGRLMEIMAECYQVDMPFRYFVRGGMTESLINTFIDLRDEMDFSKL